MNDLIVAVFGVEFSQYTVNENAEELLVNVVLLESELAFPVLLHLSPSDISAGYNKKKIPQPMSLVLWRTVAQTGHCVLSNWTFLIINFDFSHYQFTTWEFLITDFLICHYMLLTWKFHISKFNFSA